MASDDFGGVLVEEQQTPQPFDVSLDTIRKSPAFRLTNQIIGSIQTPLKVAQMNAMVPIEQEPLRLEQSPIPSSPEELAATNFMRQRDMAKLAERLQPQPAEPTQVEKAMEFMRPKALPKDSGVFAPFREAFREPLEGPSASAASLAGMDLKDWLESEYKTAAESPPPESEFFPGAQRLVGGLFGSGALVAGSSFAGPVGPFAAFASSGYGSQLKNSYINARSQGKSPEESLAIAKATAPVAGITGGLQALILPGAKTGLVKSTAQMAGAGGAGQAALNVAQSAAGLPTPILQGVPEQAAIMGGVPLAFHIATGKPLASAAKKTEAGKGALHSESQLPGTPEWMGSKEEIARKIEAIQQHINENVSPDPAALTMLEQLKAEQARLEGVPHATKARQVEGGVPGERPGTDAQRTTPEAGPSDSLQRTKEGPAQEKGQTRDEVLLDQQIKDLEQDPSATGSMPDVVPVDAEKQAKLQQLRAERDRIVQSKSINIEDPQTKSTIEDVANQLKESGQSGGFKFDHVVEGHPLFKAHGTDVMWTDISDGSVHVNTAMIPKWIKENMLTNAQFRKWFESGLTHEVIHSNLLEALKGKASETMAQYWKDGTWLEQKLTDMAYNRKGERVTDPALLGHEMFRRHAERFAGLTPTEVVQSKGMEWVTQKFIDLLERGIFEARRKWGTKASQRQLEILNKYQKNIDLVRKARGWKSPEEGSLRMEPAKDEKKALEPNPPVGTTIKENLAQHRVEPPEQWREVLDKYGVSYGGKWEGMDLYNADLKDSGAGISWRGNTTPEQLAEKINAKRREFVEAEKKKASIEKPAETALRMEPKKSALEEDPSMGKVAASLNRYRMALRTVFKASPNRKIMDQRFDGADTAANNAGQQARNSIDIGSTPIEREATMAIIEANGDREKLAQFLAQSKKNPKAAAAVRYANANWDRLQPLAERTQKILDSQIKDENNNGISTEFREAYVPHIYDTDLLMGKGMPYVISGKGSGGSTGFKKGRTFDTVFDAIEAGYTPKSIDVGKLVEHRVKVGQRLINRKQWSEGLREIKDPTDNRPLVTDIETHQRPNGTAYQSAPMGYERREIIPGVSIAIHSGYSSLFDALTGTSRISGSAPGRAALATAGGIKHGLLLFDTFHASRIMQKQLFLTGKISYGKGHSLLEYSDADLGRAVQSNLITPDVATWIKEHRSDANLLVKEGLNVGRIQEALYADMIKSLQEKAAKAAEKIGVPESIANKLQFSKWVFEKVTRGAMMESALIELERISKAQPDVPRAEIARKVARDLNTYFGNLGRQGFFKSRTMQDLMNLSFLAPQWMESMARSEVKGALQMAKGVTIDPVLNRTILLGSLGKGMAGGLLAYLVGTQLLNMATRGHPTWDNPEEKHRLDAWIPDLEGGSKGFFMSPMSVPAELTHDMIRYYNSNPRFLSAVGRIMQNKISPLARASQILFIGKDWDKNMVTDDWDRVKRASIALTPTPLPLSPLVREQSPSGSLQRQLTASAGFKTEPAESGRRTVRPSRPPHKLKRLPSR